MAISFLELSKKFRSQSQERHLRNLEHRIFKGEYVEKKSLVDAIRKFAFEELKDAYSDGLEVFVVKNLTLNLSAMAEKVFQYGESAADKISEIASPNQSSDRIK